MTWFKVDDSLAFHAKTVAAGNLAMGLWLRAGSWCAAQGTEGRVPKHMVGALAGNKAAAEKLVAAGLWLAVDGGYQFHDWHDYQPTKAEVDEARRVRYAAKSEAGRIGGIASGVARRKQKGSRTEADTKHGPKQMGSETKPLPDPSRTRTASGDEVEVELPASRAIRAVR